MNDEAAAPSPTPALHPPTAATRDLADVLERLPSRVSAVHKALAGVVVGQEEVIDAILYALFSHGHCLLVGVPGLGKTLLVNALARVLGLPFARIQFTPDLMPSDITGTEILEEDPAGGRRRFAFARGPVFTNVLLADEINRTPPKTQAALLEAMQEKTVSIAGKAYRLEEPFLVLATQNPIEHEGTYPLPEAQLDRFLFELRLGYPGVADERRIVEQHSFQPTDNLTPVLGVDEILALRHAIAGVPASPPVVDYAVRLTRATRPEDPTSPDYVRRWVRWGASPRASQYLVVAGRARAARLGRYNVSREDVAALAPLVLRHRILRSFEADAEGVDADQVIARLLKDVKGA